MTAETIRAEEGDADVGLVPRVLDAVGGVVVGQREMLERLMVGLLANGHILLEGVPGIAKTLAVTSIARALHADYKRIQFTPDLLPADLIGTLIYRPQSGEFQVRKGPIFANVLLADEINRAPAKVQSALLESMQEGQVTIGEETYQLPTPFFVLATQNPIEQEGTYPLPEAQIDRFMMKLAVTYPDREEEIEILERMSKTAPVQEIEPVATLDDVVAAREKVDAVYVDDKVKNYIVDIVFATRDPASVGPELERYLEFGASPRATIFLTLAAKAYAFVQGRDYVTPHDVKSIGRDVLRHRLHTTFEAEADGVTPDDLVKMVFDHVPVP